MSCAGLLKQRRPLSVESLVRQPLSKRYNMSDVSWHTTVVRLQHSDEGVTPKSRPVDMGEDLYKAESAVEIMSGKARDAESPPVLPTRWCDPLQG